MPATVRSPSLIDTAGRWVNDVHSRLSCTWVRAVERPASRAEISRVVRRAAKAGTGLCVCGGRHAMGGQPFGTGTTLLDLSAHTRLLHLDRERGLVRAEAGIRWPALLAGLHELQRGSNQVWTIRQKQTGADKLSLGGALSANVHGRGLRSTPIVADVEAFTLVNAQGQARTCSRTENTDLFALAIGGYGCFGVIAEVTLRLTHRHRLERRVEMVGAERLMAAFQARIAAGYTFGDWQFNIDENSLGFLREGVFSCYRPLDEPVSPQLVPAAGQRELTPADWRRLLILAHTDRTRAFAEYARFYLATDGQRYWSDFLQFGTYLEGYHDEIDRTLGCKHPGSESIAELYVPRPALAGFLAEAADLLRAQRATVIYGTVRLIEAEAETFLAWARAPWACIVFNLHVEHTATGIAAASATFRALYDLALVRSGSFYLTYGRHAGRGQTLVAYPQFEEFLRRQQRLYDPIGLWRSDWLRHHREMFGVA